MGLAQTRWLAHYATCFETVELNNVFYRLPPRSTFEAWAAALPEGFVVSVKASRYLTHLKRLKDPEEPVRRLVERAQGLGSRLGPFLLQLPPHLACEPEALEAALASFPPAQRVAVELRHPSWFSSRVRDLLERWGAALCLVDGGPVSVPTWRTACWGYVRFHHGRGRPEPCYEECSLRDWAFTLADVWGPEETVFAYFNNDGHGCAPRDAARLAKLGRQFGLQPSRVPEPEQVPLTG